MFEYPSLHADVKSILTFLCAALQIIKPVHGKAYPPAISLLKMESWLYKGIEEEKDVGAAMILWISAVLSLEHLLGHFEAKCKRGPACRGGPTCDEKMTLEKRGKGHLFHFLELLQDSSRAGHYGVYGTLWHVGSALLNVLPKPLTVRFMHPVLRCDPRESIWTPFSEAFWRVLRNSKDHEQVRKEFRRRVLAGWSECQETGEELNDGMESWLDEDM